MDPKYLQGFPSLFPKSKVFLLQRYSLTYKRLQWPVLPVASSNLGYLPSPSRAPCEDLAAAQDSLCSEGLNRGDGDSGLCALPWECACPLG